MIKSKLYGNIILVPILLALLVLVSCSTKKNTFTSRAYHNLTAHYNGYFNGNESMKDGLAELNKSAQDDYRKVLPVFNLGARENAQAIGPYMDKAIQKAGMVINRHSIFIKKVEHNKWIDDCYMMIGKANFYKHEYKTANRTFDFVIKRYNNPIKYDGMLWMARTYCQTGEFDKAEPLLDLVQEKLQKERISSKFEKDLSMVYANYYILQENYTASLDYLLRAIDLNHNKAQRTRMRFILAQIYQKKGNLKEASDLYRKVISKNPSYEMAFNAKINLALCYDASQGGSKDIIAKLKKMLKDEKNKDYQDRIYYALAEIAAKEGDMAATKDYLKESVKASTTNKYQRAASAIRLADLYFGEPDYPNAQAYYDSALQVLPKEYPDYDALEAKSKVLTDLVDNINTVQLEDSLQKLGKMSEAERNKVIDQIIAKVIKEEQDKKREENEAKSNLPYLQDNRMRSSATSGSGWYFYNPSAISLGYSEFIRKWGKRKLEDNWRLSNKEPTFDFEETTAATVDTAVVDSSKIKSTDPKSKKTYLQNIPLTDEQFKASDEKIVEALYNEGIIYNEGLRDPAKAVEAFEIMFKRFPEHKIAVKACYELFKTYEALDNKTKTEFYKNLILSKYPESDYAKLIIDPNYKVEMAARRNKAAGMYADTYDAYQQGAYGNVLANCSKALLTYDDKGLLSKFALLEALTKGKTSGIDTMVVKLKKVVRRYPESDAAQYAKTILERFGSKDSIFMIETTGSTDKQAAPASLYKFDSTAIHLFVLIADIKDVNINALKLRISDYDMKFHSLDNLTVSSVFLDNSRQMITVSNFPDKGKAMDYLSGLNNSSYVFSQMQGSTYTDFVISVENYPVFYKNKDLQKYLNFFQANYK